MKGFLEYVKRNPSLGLGLVMLLSLLLFTSIGRLFITPDQPYKQSIDLNQPPSSNHWFGTDSQGRDVFAMMVLGSGMTLQIGVIAGAIGLGVGIVLG